MKQQLVGDLWAILSTDGIETVASKVRIMRQHENSPQLKNGSMETFVPLWNIWRVILEDLCAIVEAWKYCLTAVGE